jgi:hypothetical protein
MAMVSMPVADGCGGWLWRLADGCGGGWLPWEGRWPPTVMPWHALANALAMPCPCPFHGLPVSPENALQLLEGKQKCVCTQKRAMMHDGVHNDGGHTKLLSTKWWAHKIVAELGKCLPKYF